MKKILALLLSIAFLCSVFSAVGIQSVNSSSNVPIPQFTVRYIDESFDASTSPSIDPYTGESIPPINYHVDRRYIQVSIKNDLPTIPAGSYSEYYYNVRSKGQFTEEWTETRTAAYGYYRPSDSAYTLINYSMSGFSISGQDPPVGTKIDFQVILMYGGIGKDISQGPLGPEYFIGETSGWSSTKTVTIGDTSTPTENAPSTSNPNTPPPQNTTTSNPNATPSQNSTTSQEPRQPEPFPTTLVAVASGVSVVLVGIGLLVYFRKRKMNSGIKHA